MTRFRIFAAVALLLTVRLSSTHPSCALNNNFLKTSEMILVKEECTGKEMLRGRNIKEN